jgi:hypothetical protein
MRRPFLKSPGLLTLDLIHLKEPALKTGIANRNPGFAMSESDAGKVQVFIFRCGNPGLFDLEHEFLPFLGRGLELND